jgi:hypothetical protein
MYILYIMGFFNTLLYNVRLIHIHIRYHLNRNSLSISSLPRNRMHSKLFTFILKSVPCMSACTEVIKRLMDRSLNFY